MGYGLAGAEDDPPFVDPLELPPVPPEELPEPPVDPLDWPPVEPEPEPEELWGSGGITPAGNVT